MNNKNTIEVKPFRKFIMTLGALPTSYLESMSYAEMLMWFCNFLQNEVIPATNNNAEAIEELQHYFDNLNVQEEIDHKLDEMAEAGTLEEIIGAYLEAQSVLGFNTVADLEDATNLINGSFARTYGKLTYDDGEGAFYKIRLKTEDDVIDGDLIVGLDNFSTLVAEKMSDKAINDINDDIDTIGESITDIQGDISDINEKLSPVEMLKGKNFVVFGDSYSAPEIVNSADEYWVKQVETATGMNRFNYSVAGAGFTRDANMMSDQLTTALSEMTADEIANTKIVIVYGGINDLLDDALVDDIVSDASDLMHDIHTAYPNAKLILAPFNWGYGRLNEALNSKCTTALIRLRTFCYDLPIVILDYARFWNIGFRTWFRNDTHPNETGYKNIATYMIGAIYGSPEHVGFSDVIELTGTSAGVSYYTHTNGMVEVELYCKFSGAIEETTQQICSYVPTVAVPQHDLLVPLYMADGTNVGCCIISNTGTMTLAISGTLPANTYVFMTPVTYRVNANREWVS